MASGGRAKRFRGAHTHGRGKKAGRGAGLKGGRGRAGANKHRFLMLQVLGGKHAHLAARPWGRVGFKYRSRDTNVTDKPEVLNVGDLALRFPGKTELDLGAEGYGKLLGSGEIKHKVTIKVDQASPGAVKKVQAAGGSVVILKAPEPKKAAAPAKGAPAAGGKPAAAAPKADKPQGAKGDKPAGDKPKQ